jgi:dolichol-phosphate mannosyltransferase
MLSIVMPARDEEGSIVETIAEIAARLRAERIAYEIVVVDDGSRDGTRECVLALGSADAGIRLVDNEVRHGFGMAVRAGLPHCTGDAVVIMMADGSDSPADLVAYYRKFEAGHACVFGSRFIRGGKVIGYPVHKRLINRLANWFIKVLFGLRYNDVTNAFKCYSREAIEHMQPLMSPHFNLTVEMPLKAIVRGFSYTVVPITWTNRKAGVSKLKIKEMGSRYLFIVLYLWLEKTLSRGDYAREAPRETSDREAAAKVGADHV